MNIGDVVELEGWLVVIGFRLFLVPEEYSENYEEGDRVEISRPEIMFSIMDKILPLGGGKSSIFHRARIAGVLEYVLPAKVKVTSIFVEERGGGFICIDLEDDSLEKNKARYDEFIRKNQSIKSDDWLDYL